MEAGMISFGLYAPSAYETADDVARRAGLEPGAVNELGIERKCRPGPEEQPVVMARRAAEEALRSAQGVTAEDVDVVIWTGEEYKDYIAQTPSIRLQEETGCKDAWAFDLVGQGVTLIQGIRLARDLMSSDPAVGHVLLAGGTRNVDLVDYRDPDTRFLLSYAASGGALLLGRSGGRAKVLQTAFLVDAEMADEVYVPGGGTEHPFSPDNLDSPIMYYRVQHPENVREYLSGRWVEALVETGLKALSGQRPDYVALRHLAPAERARVLKGLGVGEDASASLARWGHHGTNDVLFSLREGLEEGKVKEGSLVLMLTGGIGFTYAAALLRWGEQA